LIKSSFSLDYDPYTTIKITTKHPIDDKQYIQTSIDPHTITRLELIDNTSFNLHIPWAKVSPNINVSNTVKMCEKLNKMIISKPIQNDVADNIVDNVLCNTNG
jgi:hypothetical protein